MVSIYGKREPPKKDFIPGPGSYNNLDTINRDKSPSYRMGTAKRSDIIDKKQVELSPGPGNYDVNRKIGDSGPSYSF